MQLCGPKQLPSLEGLGVGSLIIKLCGYAVMRLCSYAVMQLCSYAVMFCLNRKTAKPQNCITLSTTSAEPLSLPFRQVVQDADCGVYVIDKLEV
jgi:hypothetical protein